MDTDSTRNSKMARNAVSEVIALQRRIFKRHRRAIESNEGLPSSGFAKYRNEYKNSVSGFICDSGFGAVCDALAKSDVAYVADYHTLRLAQKTFVKLIQSVQQQADNICLALEFVDAKYQDDLNKYLEHKINESTFLKRTNYKEHWPYDIWPNFKPIFELAITNGFPVIGIDTDASLSLRKRDSFAAARIAELLKDHPDSVIFVFAGQMHMAPAHLPAKVDQACLKARIPIPQSVIVYQNAEEIYWQLAREGRENVEVVQVGEREYCINNTPPLVQQLSYLNWIQNDEELIEYSDLEHTVQSLIKDIAHYLDIEPLEAHERVRVLMPGDLDLMDLLDTHKLDAYSKKQIIRHVEAEESVCIPDLELIYLATLSVNHAAEEAAHYLKSSVSGGYSPDDPKDLFYYTVLNEACAFFASKIINPKRKADHQGRLRTQVAQARQKKPFSIADKAAQFVLEHLAFERNESKKSIKSATNLSNVLVFNTAAHQLGYILGDRLYYGLIDGVVPKSIIRKLFLSPLDKENEALEQYLTLSTLVRFVKIPKRI